MKFGKYEIVSGPNLQFYIATIFFAYWSWTTLSLWPIVGWTIFWVAMILLSLWIYSWEEQQRKKLLEDFPYDREIQRKYGQSRVGDVGFGVRQSSIDTNIEQAPTDQS